MKIKIGTATGCTFNETANYNFCTVVNGEARKTAPERIEDALVVEDDCTTTDIVKTADCGNYETETVKADFLRILINNDEVYEETVKRLNVCERPKKINELVYKYLKANTKVPRERLRKEDVIRSFFPHLKKYKCKLDVECIQKALE